MALFDRLSDGFAYQANNSAIEKPSPTTIIAPTEQLSTMPGTFRSKPATCRYFRFRISTVVL